MASTITYTDKVDGSSSATAADFNEIKSVVNANSLTAPGTLWNATLENPLYGEELDSGLELFLDGTKEYVSSDGRKPVEDVVDYLPAKFIVDGTETDEARSKWPGNRGTYGFFGEYENEAGGSEDASVVSTVSTEGGWLKVLSTGTANAYARFDFTALSTTGYCQVYVKKGNSVSTNVNVTGTVTGLARITWGSPPTIAFTTAVDAGSIIISDEIVLLKFKPTNTAGTALRLLANHESTLSGDYSYFKEWTVVDLDYPVPYTKGTHQANKLQYDYDYSAASSHTLQGWFYANEQGASQFVLDTRNASGDDSIQVYYDGSNWLLATDDGTLSTLILTGITNDAWNHVKLVFASTASVGVYTNGGALQNKTTNIPDVDNMSKVMNIGSDYAFANQLEGFTQDWTIQPTADITDTHYTAGLPYYNPNKTYGQAALWSIDNRGNISGLPQATGIIVEEYELDGQHVTKWDTGRMDNRGSTTATSGGVITYSFVESFIDTSYIAVSTVLYSSAARTVTHDANTVNGIDIYTWDSSSAANNSTAKHLIIGRWK